MNGGQPRIGVGDVILRTLPGSSPLHRLWAGTKIICVATLTLAVSLFPGWPTAAVGVAVTVLAARAGRVPLKAVPRLPWWFAVALGIGAGLSSIGAGLASFALFLVLGWELIALSMILGWTTPLADLAPAMSTLLHPLRRLRLPVTEWVVTIALCVRSLPMLIEELRVVVAARRMRFMPHRTGLRRAAADGIGLISAVMVACIRRASDMGQTIQARGGTAHPHTRLAGPRITAHTCRPGQADALALTVVSVFLTFIVYLAQLFPSGY